MKQKKEIPEDHAEPMQRTTAGLRDAMFDEIDNLRSGRSNPATARSLAMLSNTVLQSVKTEIEFHKFVADANKTEGAARLGVLELGATPVILEDKSDQTAH